MSTDLQNMTQNILSALDQLQNDLYLKIKLYEKYILWSSFFLYGSDIKKCNTDLENDPRCSDEYFKFISEYGLEPQDYVVYMTSLNSYEMDFNIGNLKDIAVYIKSVTDPSGRISIQDNAEKDKVLTTMGEYLGATVYFNKIDYFIEQFNNFTGNYLASNQGAYFEALFGDLSGLSNRQSLYQQQINTQLKLLNQHITTQNNLQKYTGVFIKNVSYAPTIIIQEYNKVSLEYREGFKQMYEILKSVPELQMCLSNVNVGDIEMQNISNSDININCEAISNCISGNNSNTQSDQKTEENVDNENNTNEKNNNKSNKKIYIIIICIVIVLLILFSGSLIIYFKCIKKNKPTLNRDEK